MPQPPGNRNQESQMPGPQKDIVQSCFPHLHTKFVRRHAEKVVTIGGQNINVNQSVTKGFAFEKSKRQTVDTYA